MKTSNLVRGVGIAVVVLIVVGVGAYMYATRPLEGHDSSISDVSAQLTNTTQAETGSGTTTERFQIASSRSKASFSIYELLSGKDKTVIGTTDQVAGTIVVNTADPSKSTASDIAVSARTLKTDSTSRDHAVARFILKSEDPANEFITFKPQKIEGLPATGETGKSYPLTISGDLTIAGVTRPQTFTSTVVYTGANELQITAKATLHRGDYNLVIPSVPIVANVGEDVTVDLDLVATKLAQ